MESKKINQISIDIPNFSGPLEVLLELAKNQKVDYAYQGSCIEVDSSAFDKVLNQQNL